MAPCAGDAFALDTDQLEISNVRVEEMDKLEVINLDPATFKYESGLIEVFRQVEDPHGIELNSVLYQRNPAEPTQPIKVIELF